MKEKEKEKEKSNQTVNKKIAERLEKFNKMNFKDSVKSKSVKTKKVNNEEGD
jgi:hypothetical protein